MQLMLNPFKNTEESMYAPISLGFDALKNIGNYGNGNNQYDILRDIITSMPIPFMGNMIQQYWGLPDKEMSTWNKGSALKGHDRTGSLLPLIMPGLFGSVSRNYYFSYDGSNKVYMTHDNDSYQKHLDRGAIAVETTDQAQAILDTPQKTRFYWPRNNRYFPKTGNRYYRSYRRYPKTKRRYARKSYIRRDYDNSSFRGYFRGTYASKYYGAGTAQRVIRSVRNTQMRIPSTVRNMSYLAPSLYRKYFSASGANAFKVRLQPTNYNNIRYRIKQSWSYLR
jgi:hypothetical protein